MAHAFLLIAGPMMETLERYKNEGLENPILIVTSLKTHAFVWGAGFFLLGACILALIEGNLYEQLIGLFGLFFFGLSLGILAVGIYRGRTKGLIGLYKDGLWLSTFDAILPWQCIVSSWVTRVGSTSSVMVLVKGIDDHIRNPNIITHFLLWLMERAADLNKHPLTHSTLVAFQSLNMGAAEEGQREAF